ncbi:hypothetical protein ASF69_20075 [Rhizobium sp. Leaf311]|uniref:FAD-dependent monooxygenase n=1 Tax=Rhizobium sp. Leaf311 TaxID=1736332 RepID=UPI00071563E4|nr:FAD-dependent monooxygenase [Rhizobium sp. Leaf311]KQQ54228.1 hypothetical protein ASF69_20075 [Rhizobium sp. Leaf311]
MKIIVAGAGIAGLSVAKALELKGHQCHIVEQSEASSSGGMGIFLLGNATRALRQLGVLEAIEPNAYPIKKQLIFASNGQLIHETESQEFWSECGPCLAMPRSLLIQSLLSSLDNTDISYGKAVVDVENTMSGVRALYSDGSSQSCDLVIAADGIHSRLRNAAFNIQPRPLGITCWRTVVDNTAGIDTWTAMLGRGRTLLAIPLSETKVYLYADCRTADVRDNTVLGLRDLFAEFQSPLGELVGQLNSPTEIHFGELREVPEHNRNKHGLVLMGDAAHACSPSMAQGAGMALEDALVLADLVSRYASTAVINRAFVAQRRDRVAWVRKQSRVRDKVRNLPPTVRNLMLRNLGDRLYTRSYATLRKPLI